MGRKCPRFSVPANPRARARHGDAAFVPQAEIGDRRAGLRSFSGGVRLRATD